MFLFGLRESQKMYRVVKKLKQLFFHFIIFETTEDDILFGQLFFSGDLYRAELRSEMTNDVSGRRVPTHNISIFDAD